MSIQVRTIVSMPVEENSYVAWLEGEREAIVVDPGFETDPILAALRRENLGLAAILNTHGHADHIAGNAAIKAAFPDAPLVVGANETALLEDPDQNLSALFGFPLSSPPADQTVKEGDVLEFAGLRLEVLDVPGHSPGHVVFLYRADIPHLFGGDVLFAGSIGRTDFPGSSHRLLVEGIRQKLFTLPGDTVVYPGHGPTTTIAREARSNPFV